MVPAPISRTSWRVRWIFHGSISSVRRVCTHATGCSVWTVCGGPSTARGNIGASHRHTWSTISARTTQGSQRVRRAARRRPRAA
ncbi:MAG: hypothetical protein M5R40_20885 [Anaerolineae bacterium]|nr:hypothetical protein [Anaerolineae bacterium]